MMNLIGKALQFASDHKKGIAGVAAAGLAPVVIANIPKAHEFATSLPQAVQWGIGFMALVLALAGGVKAGRHVGRLVESARQRAGELMQRYRETKARNWKAGRLLQAFWKGTLPGADKVSMVELSAGNISNISKEPSTLPPALQEELAAAKRVVAVIGDTSPGLELDEEPDLLTDDHGLHVAEVKISPVRNDIKDAIGRTEMWLDRQEPMYHSFLSGCEVQVGIQIAAPGCTSLTNSLHGFGLLDRGSEANFLVYVHDPREEAGLGQKAPAGSTNGHREPAEVPSLVAAGGIPSSCGMTPEINITDGRPRGTVERRVDHRSFEDQLLALETELYERAASNGDRVILISNRNGQKQNSVIRRTIDTIESASLRNYYPLGSGPSRSTYPDHADVSHMVAGPWQPSTPMSFGDSHAAVVAAKEIASGQWDSQFYGYIPEVPLELRQTATIFVTGNPRAGLAFTHYLEGALPMNHTFITHWNERSPAAYVVFCVPVFHEEIKAAGLRFPSQVFTKQAG